MTGGGATCGAAGGTVGGLSAGFASAMAASGEPILGAAVSGLGGIPSTASVFSTGGGGADFDALAPIAGPIGGGSDCFAAGAGESAAAGIFGASRIGLVEPSGDRSGDAAGTGAGLPFSSGRDARAPAAGANGSSGGATKMLVTGVSVADVPGAYPTASTRAGCGCAKGGGVLGDDCIGGRAAGRGSVAGCDAIGGRMAIDLAGASANAVSSRVSTPGWPSGGTGTGRNGPPNTIVPCLPRSSSRAGWPAPSGG